MMSPDVLFQETLPRAFVALAWIGLSAAGIAGLVFVLQLAAGRRLTPAWRYRLWGLVVLRLLLPVLPASPTSLANWLHGPSGEISQNAPATVAPSEAATSAHPAPHLADSNNALKVVVSYGPIDEASQSLTQAPTSHRPATYSKTALLFVSGIWLAGALLGLVRLLVANALFARKIRSGIALADAEVATLLRSSQGDAIGRLPRVVITGGVCVPAAAGVWPKRVLIPPGLFQRLDADERRAVLLHELAHIKHRDVAINWLLALLEILHWFNPFIRLAFARLRTDREIVRDQEVLRTMAGHNPQAAADRYARVLLHLTELLSGIDASAGPLATVGIVTRPSGVETALFGARSSLKRRLREITDLPTSSATRSLLGPILALALASCTLTRGTDRAAAPATNLKSASATQPHATGASDESIDDMVARVWELTGQSKYAEALTLNERILARDPHNQYAASIQELLGDKALARRHYFHVTPQSDAVIHAQLNRTIPQLSFDAGALSDVIDLLRVTSGANIFVNWKSLQAAGIDRSTPVTCRMHNVKVAKALSMIVDSVGGGQTRLAYEVSDGVVMISTLADMTPDVIVRVYDVRDILVNVPDFEPGLPPGGAPATSPANITHEELVSQLVNLIEDTVAPDTWKTRSGQSGAIRELQGQLIITQTPENQIQIVNLLEQLRQTRHVQVKIEARFISCDRKHAEDLLARWQTPSTVAARPATLPARSNTIAFLDDRQAADFLRLSDSVGGVLLTAPRITLFNGQRAYIQATSRKSYVADYLTVTTPAGETRYDPIHTAIETGVIMDVQATISADRKSITLTLRPKLSALLGMKQTPWPGRPPGSNLIREEPKVRATELQTTVNVPDGGTVLLGGMDDPGLSREIPAPDQQPRSLFLLVKPAVIAQYEVARPAAKSP